MNKKNFWISLSLIIATLVVIRTMHFGTDVVVVKKNLDRIPYAIGSMRGVDIPLEESVIKGLDPDVFVFRNYISKDKRPINLYIGYYGTSKGGRSAHNPEGCYPGAGWAILEEHAVTMPLNNMGGVLP